MHKSLIILTAALAMAGCSTTRERDRLVSTAPSATLMAPQPAVRQVPRATQASLDPSVASLQPGATYVASFPEADRRAACERLNYQPGTRAYRDCLEGNFKENPYFAQAN
jgi:uncharacterized lipoprotein YajG